DPDHHSEPMPECGVEEPPGRSGIAAHRVEAAPGDQLEVALDRLRRAVASTVRGERTVGDTLHIELLVPEEQELAADGGSGRSLRGDGLARLLRSLEQGSADGEPSIAVPITVAVRLAVGRDPSNAVALVTGREPGLLAGLERGGRGGGLPLHVRAAA